MDNYYVETSLASAAGARPINSEGTHTDTIFILLRGGSTSTCASLTRSSNVSLVGSFQFLEF